MSTVTDLLEDYEAGRLDPGATLEEFSELIRGGH